MLNKKHTHISLILIKEGSIVIILELLNNTLQNFASELVY